MLKHSKEGAMTKLFGYPSPGQTLKGNTQMSSLQSQVRPPAYLDLSIFSFSGGTMRSVRTCLFGFRRERPQQHLAAVVAAGEEPAAVAHPTDARGGAHPLAGARGSGRLGSGAPLACVRR